MRGTEGMRERNRERERERETRALWTIANVLQIYGQTDTRVDTKTTTTLPTTTTLFLSSTLLSLSLSPSTTT